MRKSFKKRQKAINKEVRRFNKYMEEDEAFLGRIYARQYSSGIHKYPDGSVVWLGVIRIYDKVTNTYRSVSGNEFSIIRELWLKANDFVIEDLDIDTFKAIALHVDYRNVKHNPREAVPFYQYYNQNFSYKQSGIRYKRSDQFGNTGN